MPPDVVEMQMRIDDVLNPAELCAGSLEPIEEVRLEVVPARHRCPLLPIPDTWINDDLLARDDDQEPQNHSPQATGPVNEIGCHPWHP